MTNATCAQNVLHRKGKAKAVPVHAKKAHRGWTVHLHSFLTLALDGGQRLASRPWPLYLKVKTHALKDLHTIKSLQCSCVLKRDPNLRAKARPLVL